MIRIGNADQGSKVEDNIRTFHSISYTIRIAYITGKDPDSISFFPWKSINPTPTVKRVIMNECRNMTVYGYKGFNQVTSYKTTAPVTRIFFLPESF